LSAGRDGFGDLGDLCQLLEVQFNPQAWPLIGIKFPVLEVQADREMRQGAPLVVILYSMRTGAENVPRLLTRAAVAMGPVKCGAIPTK